MSSPEKELYTLLSEMNRELHEIKLLLLRRRYHRSTEIYLSVRFWAMLSGLMALSVGLVLIIGGADRVSANAYWGLNTYGGDQVWGLFFFSAGVITLLTMWLRPRMLECALAIQALPYLGFFVIFTWAAFQFPDANLTAPPVYGWITVMNVFLADMARREKKQNLRGRKVK